MNRQLSPDQKRLAIELVAEAPQFMDKLGRAGLLRTHQKMGDVVQEIGWELADFLRAEKR